MIDTDQPVKVSKIEVIENVMEKPSDAEAKVNETEHKSTEPQDQGADEVVASSSTATAEPATTPASIPSTTKSAITSPTPTKTDSETEKSKCDAGKEKESDKEKSEEKENDKKQKEREKDKAKESIESSIVTPDYIQQSMFRLFYEHFLPACHIFSNAKPFFPFPYLILLAIQNALRQGNLNPEIEEKLLNLQRCHEKQMKGVQRPTSVALANNHHEYTSPVKYSSTSRGKHAANRSIENDDEWIMETPKRRPPRSTSFSEKGKAQNAAVVENDVNRIIRSVAEESGSVGAGSASAATTTVKTPVKSEPRTPVKKHQIVPTPVKRTVPTPINSTIATPEPKPVNNVVSEISPNRRLAQTKKDNEKKKQMQVRKWLNLKCTYVCF